MAWSCATVEHLHSRKRLQLIFPLTSLIFFISNKHTIKQSLRCSCGTTNNRGWCFEYLSSTELMTKIFSCKHQPSNKATMGRMKLYLKWLFSWGLLNTNRTSSFVFYLPRVSFRWALFSLTNRAECTQRQAMRMKASRYTIITKPAYICSS